MFFILTSIAQAGSPSPSPSSSGIPALLSDVIHLEKFNYPSAATCGGGVVNLPEIKLPFDRMPARAPGMCELSAASFCATAQRGCESRHRSLNCAAQNPSARKSRVASSQLRKDIFAFASRYFTETKDDPTAIEHCCGDLDSQDYRSCADHFTKTKLYLLKGLPETDQTAYYLADLKQPRVEVSEAALLSCETEECVQYLILHELGHACEWSRDNFNPSLDKCSDAFVSREDLSDFFGEETSDCLFNANLKAAQEHDKKLKHSLKKNGFACMEGWLRENFADAVFIDRWQSPYNGAWICNAASDPMHGPESVLLVCLFKNKKIQSLFCGKMNQ